MIKIGLSLAMQAVVLSTVVGAEPEMSLLRVPPEEPVTKSWVLVNLARPYFGASVVSSGAGSGSREAADAASLLIGENQVLLSEDPAQRWTLRNGKQEILIALPEVYMVERFNFFNLQAKGSYEVYTSPVSLPADSPKWKLAGKADFQGRQAHTLRIPRVDVRRMKIVFQVNEPGEITSLGIFGRVDPSTLTSLVVDDQAGAPVAASTASSAPPQANLGNRLIGARVAGISSGEPTRAYFTIDDDAESYVDFETKSDTRPSILLDLGSPREVSRVSFLTDSQPGMVDIYLLNTLPDGTELSESAGAGLALSESVIDRLPKMASLAFVLPVVPVSWGQNQPNVPVLKIPPDFFVNNKPAQSVEILGDGSLKPGAFASRQARFILFTYRPGPEGRTRPFRVFTVAVFGNYFHRLDPEPPPPASGPSVAVAAVGAPAVDLPKIPQIQPVSP
jgi:hypothetical protein